MYLMHRSVSISHKYVYLHKFIISEADKYDISLQIIRCRGYYEGMHYNKERKINEHNIQ
jgi:hypothetical protein